MKIDPAFQMPPIKYGPSPTRNFIAFVHADEIELNPFLISDLLDTAIQVTVNGSRVKLATGSQSFPGRLLH